MENPTRIVRRRIEAPATVYKYCRLYHMELESQKVATLLLKEGRGEITRTNRRNDLGEGGKGGRGTLYIPNIWFSLRGRFRGSIRKKVRPEAE